MNRWDFMEGKCIIELYEYRSHEDYLRYQEQEMEVYHREMAYRASEEYNPNE